MKNVRSLQWTGLAVVSGIIAMQPLHIQAQPAITPKLSQPAIEAEQARANAAVARNVAAQIAAQADRAKALAADAKAAEVQVAALQAAAQQATAVQVVAETHEADAVIKAAEHKLALAQEHVKAGLVPASTLVQAQLELAQARLRLAIIQERSPDILQNLELILKHQENVVTTTTELYKQGVVPLADVHAARIALAEARIRFELYTLVSLHEENLRHVRASFEAGVATQQQVQTASQSLNESRARFFKENILQQNAVAREPQQADLAAN